MPAMRVTRPDGTVYIDYTVRAKRVGVTGPPTKPKDFVLPTAAPPPLKAVPQPVPIPEWFLANTTIPDLIQRARSRQMNYFFYLEEPTDKLKEAFLFNYNRDLQRSLEQQIYDDEVADHASESSSSDLPIARAPSKKLKPRKPNDNRKRARTLKRTLQGHYNEIKPLLQQMQKDQELSDFQFRRVLRKYLQDDK